MALLAGLEHGRAQGEEAGEVVGYNKGLELGRELGRYRGRVAILLAFLSAREGLAPERCDSAIFGPTALACVSAIPAEISSPLRALRIRGTLTRLAEALAAIRLDDPLDQDAFDALDDARAKMRLVDVWLRGPSGPLAAGSQGNATVSADRGARLPKSGPQQPDLSF